MAFKHQIKHQQSPDFRRDFATGMVVQGLSDGMVHITFYRDVSKVATENFVSEKGPQPGDTSIELKPDAQPVDSENYREDVCTVIMPFSSMAQVSAVFNALPQALQAMQAIAKPAESTRQQ